MHHALEACPAVDITGRKQAEKENLKLEAQLRHAQKMESIGHLAGGIDHDFNNMLSVILGYAEIAAGKLKNGQPIHSHLDEVFKAAMRSAGLTRQLLAFARLHTKTVFIERLCYEGTGGPGHWAKNAFQLS